MPPFSAPPFRIWLAGERFHQDAIVLRANVGDLAEILHEVGNPQDAQALSVHLPSGERAGYIPADNWLHEAVFRGGHCCPARIVAIAPGYQGLSRIAVAVTLTDGPIGERAFAQ